MATASLRNPHPGSPRHAWALNVTPRVLICAQELTRELIATRFQLAQVVQPGTSSENCPSSPRGPSSPLAIGSPASAIPSSRRRRDSLGKEEAEGTNSFFPNPPPPRLSRQGVPALMRAVRELDLQAANEILNPSCVLAPAIRERGGASAEEEGESNGEDARVRHDGGMGVEGAAMEGKEERQTAQNFQDTLGRALHHLCTVELPLAQRDRLDVEGVRSAPVLGDSACVVNAFLT